MPSRRRRRPEPPPEFFIDRSLGRLIVPNALRAAGLVVHTMADVYGAGQEENINDETWIEEGAGNGWVLLTADEGVRYVPPEREAIERSGARVFRLSRGDLSGEEQARRFLANVNRIIQRSRRSGPFVDVVYENDVDRQWPKEP